MRATSTPAPRLAGALLADLKAMGPSAYLALIRGELQAAGVLDGHVVKVSTFGAVEQMLAQPNLRASLPRFLHEVVIETSGLDFRSLLGASCYALAGALGSYARESGDAAGAMDGFLELGMVLAAFAPDAKKAELLGALFGAAYQLGVEGRYDEPITSYFERTKQALGVTGKTLTLTTAQVESEPVQADVARFIADFIIGPTGVSVEMSREVVIALAEALRDAKVDGGASEAVAAQLLAVACPDHASLVAKVFAGPVSDDATWQPSGPPLEFDAYVAQGRLVLGAVGLSDAQAPIPFTPETVGQMLQLPLFAQDPARLLTDLVIKSDVAFADPTCEGAMALVRALGDAASHVPGYAERAYDAHCQLRDRFFPVGALGLSDGSLLEATFQISARMCTVPVGSPAAYAQELMGVLEAQGLFARRPDVDLDGSNVTALLAAEPVASDAVRFVVDGILMPNGMDFHLDAAAFGALAAKLGELSASRDDAQVAFEQLGGLFFRADKLTSGDLTCARGAYEQARQAALEAAEAAGHPVVAYT